MPEGRIVLGKRMVHLRQQEVRLDRQDLTNLSEAFNPRGNELRLVKSKKTFMRFEKGREVIF